MTVTEVTKDADALTLAITAEFDASVEQVWQLWSDPRKLERWWGPPTYPATMVEHALTPGAKVAYFMTGPDGDRHHGWWQVVAVDAPTRLEFDDGFADEAGVPNPDLPVGRVRVQLDQRDGGGTRMTVTTAFASAAAMDQVLAMGMEEGMVLAMGQMDGILSEAGAST